MRRNLHLHVTRDAPDLEAQWKREVTHLAKMVEAGKKAENNLRRSLALAEAGNFQEAIQEIRNSPFKGFSV